MGEAHFTVRLHLKTSTKLCSLGEKPYDLRQKVVAVAELESSKTE